MCRVSRSTFEGVRIFLHIVIERFLSWTRKSKGSQSCSPGKTTRSSPSSTYSDQGCISAVCFEPHALPPHRHGCPGSTHSWYPQRLSYPSVPGTLDRVGVIAVFCS